MSYDFNLDGVHRLGMRASRIRVGSKSTEGPQREETFTDLGYLERLPTDIQVKNAPSDLYLVKRSYTEDDLRRLVQSPSFFNQEKKKIDGMRSKRSDAITSFVASIARDTTITDAMNQKLLGLQKGFNVLRVYDSWQLIPEQLKVRVKSSKKYIAEYGIDEDADAVKVAINPLQGQMLLREKFNVIYSETEGPSVKFATPHRAPRQFAVIRSFNDAEKWSDMYDVPKTWHGRTSMMHIVSNYGFDTISLATRPRPRKHRGFVLRRFDDTSLGYLRMPQEHTIRYGNDLLCSCDICYGYDVHTQMDNYSPEELSRMFRGHEAFASNMEFALDRPLILQSGRELLDRYRAKEFARQAFRDVLGFDLSNRLL